LAYEARRIKNINCRCPPISFGATQTKGDEHTLSQPFYLSESTQVDFVYLAASSFAKPGHTRNLLVSIVVSKIRVNLATSMKYTVALKLLTFLIVTASFQVSSIPFGLKVSGVKLLPAISSHSRDASYINKQFGFWFDQQHGYIIASPTENLSNTPNSPLQVLQIWKQKDYSQRNNLPESPPIISITIYNNPRHLPLEDWQDQLSRNDVRPIIVARQQAIAYTATGLYESDNVLFSSANDCYVFHLKGEYI